MINILHIMPHLGGGVGSVVLNWMEKDTSDNIHTIISLDKNKNDDWIRINETREQINIFDGCYRRNNFESFLRFHVKRNDVVLIHWWNHPLTYEVMINYKLPPCRLLLWNHVNSLFPPDVMPLGLFNFVDRLVFTSSVTYECDVLKKISSKQRDKISVIWSTVGVEDFENLGKISHDSFNVGYVGTVDFGKLNRNFIKLCSQVNIPNIRFVVTSGDSQQHLMDEATSFGIAEKFDFMGRVPNVPLVLQKVDVFGYPLQPRNFATCEQALGEAMMAGCVPVVLANPTEMHIVKHMETGIIAETLEEYPRAIEYLYHNRGVLQRLSENAKIFAKNQYDIKRTIHQWNNLFGMIISIAKRKHVWNADLLNKVPPPMLYIEAMGEYATPFKQYLRAKDEKEKNIAVQGIKALFDTNSSFNSKSKGSVRQYLQFSPNDVILQEWASLL
jgi:glycosyltransferase involved in cell wall biosynthesis